MSDCLRSISRCRILASALLAATSGVASVGQTQQLAGSIGVSLTIQQPVASQPMRVTGFRVDRSGVTRLETTIPTATRASQVVMVRVSSAAMDFAPDSQGPVLVPPADTAMRLHLLVNVGRATPNGAPRRLGLRVEYLTVAGT